MGIIIRQSFKGAFVGYMGAFLGGIMTIFIYPYFLNPELIGLTRILIEFSFLFAFFGQFGITNAIVKYYPYFKSDRKKLLKLILVFPLVGFTLISLTLFVLKDHVISLYSQKSGLFVDFFYYVFPFALFSIYLNVFEVYSSVQGRIVVPKVIRDIIIRVLTLSAILFFFFFSIKVENYVLMLILSYGIASGLNIIYSIKLSRTPVTKSDDLNSGKDFFQKVITYMLFMFIAGLGANVVVRIDTLMISSMLGLEMTGIYSISFFIAMMIDIPSRATQQIAAPSISKEIAAENISGVESIYKKNTINQAIIGGAIFLLIWTNVENIFGIMPNGKIYSEGIYVILFIGMAKLIDVITGINHYILIYSKYYRYMLVWTLLLAVITFVGNYLLIPLYGINGAALASLISYIIINSTVTVFIYRKMKIHPFTIKVLFVLLLLPAFVMINKMTPSFENHYLDAIIRSLIFGVIYILIIDRFKLSNEISELLSVIKTKKIFRYLQGKE
jgi:O-antigen/teichoic acid export membrane protein